MTSPYRCREKISVTLTLIPSETVPLGGARLTHALVTARAGDEERLFAVAVEGLEPHADSWPATGMAGSDTLDVGFPAVPAEPVGPREATRAGRDSATAAPGSRRAGTAGRAGWPARWPAPQACLPGAG